MSLPSPSQLSSLYGPSSGLNSVSIPGGMPTQPFQRNVTPTSLGPSGFPMGLQSQTPSSQGQLSPNRTVTSALGGSSLLASFGRPGDPSQAGLDLSEFPTLGNRAAAAAAAASSSAAAAANRSFAAVNANKQTVKPSWNWTLGMVSKQAQEPTQEFQIQQEDFPALPGAQNPPPSSDASCKTPTSTGSYDISLKDASGKFLGTKLGTGQKRGIQTHTDGTVSNIPPGMVTDQFGMVGLLTFIRAAETDPNLVALAPGIDLTTLGLNLNSPENLYSTFQSPWADAPCRPQDIDFHVPSEYLTNVYIRDKLAPIKFNRYLEDLLFFLYYMNGGDVLQLAAAAELYNRDWRYHKEERVWITRAPGMDPVVKTSTYERGTYYYFDVQNWRKVAKEFCVEYDKLEERPHLPFLPALLQQNQIIAH